MYANRFAQPGGIRPGSLIVAIGVNAALVAGLIFASPEVVGTTDHVLNTTNIPIDEPPPPEPLPIEAKPQPQQRTTPAPEPIDTALAVKPTASDTFVLPPPLPFPTGTPGGTGSGGVDIVDPPKPAPVLTDASIDPRYADALQPAYPPGERRAERSGKVTIRVLIGPDGRVKRAERIAADSDAFWAATERQALTRWRFRPATRDGVPVESWRTMTLRFEMES